jgi:hypothetical protein
LAEYIPQPVLGLKWVAKMAVESKFVDASPSDACTGDETSIDEVVHDAMYCALTDTDQPSHFGQPYFGVLGNTHENMPVVREERPGWDFTGRHNHRWHLFVRTYVHAGILKVEFSALDSKRTDISWSQSSPLHFVGIG